MEDGDLIHDLLKQNAAFRRGLAARLREHTVSVNEVTCQLGLSYRPDRASEEGDGQ